MGTSARAAGGWKRPGGSVPAGARSTGAGADRSAKSANFCSSRDNRSTNGSGVGVSDILPITGDEPPTGEGEADGDKGERDADHSGPRLSGRLAVPGLFQLRLGQHPFRNDPAEVGVHIVG